MEYRMKSFTTVLYTVLFAALIMQSPASAKNAAAAAGQNGKQRYIVVMHDLPLAAYDGSMVMNVEQDAYLTRFPGTANLVTGADKLDVKSPRSVKYLQFLDERYENISGRAAQKLGRQLKATHRYRNAVNGFATELSEDEVQLLRNTPGVQSVLVDRRSHINTDSGPAWIGADEIHSGNAGVTPTGGERVVIGIIDTGINWLHSSFSDLGEGNTTNWDHVNPKGRQLGLCSKEGVECNDKLIGVYDYIQDDPNTDGVEENTDGMDISGHGSHVSSIAAGNPALTSIGGLLTNIAGVAPNANIVSYRVCAEDDPDTEEDESGCDISAILSAIDQAITDQVDVINLSAGFDDAFSPWTNGFDAMALLNARAAGIFVTVSAGNAGPNPSTIGEPANAPWLTAVGSATHDRVFGSMVRQLSGGDTTPPGDLFGVSLTGGIGIKPIVYAGDFGNALCGMGESETGSGTACGDYTGASNPFPANTFNGEIVVCNRGDYDFVEKSKNVMLAGAGGFIVANVLPGDESIYSWEHCLPGSHIGKTAGDQLRDWLSTGSGHKGSISGRRVLHMDEAADQISSFSSRGPNPSPAQDILKPDVIAPGSSIIGAWIPGDQAFATIQGTSMSSPHVAGAGALLKAVHLDWTPTMIASAIAMTATAELAKDFDGLQATPHKRGSGRPQLGEAVNAALYLEESTEDFLAANPAQGGDPGSLNLPGMVETGCSNECGFSRTVTDLVGGASWSVSTDGFAAGINVTVSPQNFTLADGASRQITVNLDLGESGIVGTWVYGEIRLSSDGHPDAVFTVAVFASGGELPDEWTISSEEISGWQEFELDGLTAMPDATFTSGGLVVPTQHVADLPQDPTDDSPYDDSTGLLAVLLNVPADTLWLHTETLQSTSNDLDLFVGLDVNGDGRAQESEELCSSTTPTDLELCDLFSPVAGNYWVIMQNWDAVNDVDEATLVTAVVGKNTSSQLTATGNGIVAAGATQKIRLSWDNVNVRRGTDLIGAVGIGTRRETPDNVGIIPITFKKTAVADPKTLALMNGITRGMTVKGANVHDRAYIDIPPGVNSLTVTVSGADSEQNENLEIELYRMDFDDALVDAPFAVAPDISGAPIASAMGSASGGPQLVVNGSPVSQGRWYAVVRNNRGFNASVQIRADVTFTGTPIPLHAGLWDVVSRKDSNGNVKNAGQGYDYASAGAFRALLWYTYDEDGNSDWYLGSAPEPEGNIWVSEINRYTNDGTLQEATAVGRVSVTTLSEFNHIFSFVLYGENGSDRVAPLSAHVCPNINGEDKSYTGLWSRPAAGLGGASGIVNEVSQAFIHFVYDDDGKPRWLLTSPNPQSPTTTEMPMLQFKGYCAVCDETVNPAPEEVGVFSREFTSETMMTWTLDYMFNPPLSGSIKRTDETEKLSLRLECN